MPLPNDSYLQYHIQTASQETKDWLVAILSESGIEGFEEEAEKLIASGLESGVEEGHIDEFLDENGLDYEKKRVPNQNWNAAWESSFDPVLVDDFVSIRAHFHAPVSSVKHEIIITPKMSFGTGHHETTWLMIKAMENLDFQGKVVLDFGTGTGILAILAAKLGAASVVGLDNDEWSITNAGENITQNKVDNITLELTDSLAGKREADILLANINRNILIANAASIINIVVPNGYLVLSGLLEEDEKAIHDSFLKGKLEVVSRLSRNNWIALVYKKLPGNVN